MNLFNQTSYNDLKDGKIYDSEHCLSDDDLKEELRYLVSKNNVSNNLYYKSLITTVLSNKSSLLIFENLLNTQYGKLNSTVVYQDKNHIADDDLFNRGLTNFYFGDYKKAVNDFDLTSCIGYNKIESLYYKSLSLGALNDYCDAIAILDKLISMKSRDCRFWNDKGAFLSQLKLTDDAHCCFDKSISLHQNSYNWSNKAVLYHKENKLDDALKCYNQAININKNDVCPVIGKAKIYIDLDDFENADKCFEIARKIDDCDMEFLIENGKYLLLKGNFYKAIGYFNKALRFNDRLAILWIYKAFAYKHLNKHEQSGVCLDMAIKLDRDIYSKVDDLFK